MRRGDRKGRRGPGDKPFRGMDAEKGGRAGAIRGRAGNRPGFTLLELMLSIMILGLILLIVMGALRLGFRSVEAGEKKVESLERLRSSVTLIESQIESEIPLSYEENGEKKSYFRGNRTSLDLASNYSIWGGEKGYVVVGYWVTGDPDGQWSLWARENVVGQETRRETRMLQSVQDVYFEYYVRDTTKDPKDESGRWLEEWVEEGLPTTDRLEKIKLHLVLGRKEYAWVIPLRGRQGSTRNATPVGMMSLPPTAPVPNRSGR